jgi:tetratricopeptide (TPR) repeat protein
MRLLLALITVALGGVAEARTADPLAEARRLYNQGHYAQAAAAAREALDAPAARESARLVLGRAHLELYRRSADRTDLMEAREALRAIQVDALDDRERTELMLGLGQTLYLEDRFGSASETFERLLGRGDALGPVAYERLLDWWATALDRLALSRPADDREALYTRIAARMEQERARRPASAPAAYWLAAAFRGTGDLDRAWFAAMSGWLTAMLGWDHGAALRADLDRLMIRGIIPERATRVNPKEPEPAAAVMRVEWEAFKAAWTR